MMIYWESFLEDCADDRVVAANYLCLIHLKPPDIIIERLIWILLDIEEMIRLILDRALG